MNLNGYYPSHQSCHQYIFNHTKMNKRYSLSISLFLLACDVGILRYVEACNTISAMECVNSTHYFWCIDSGDGTLVTIGDPELCPGSLICDDTQNDGCVLADTVINTESNLIPTTTVAGAVVITDLTTVAVVDAITIDSATDTLTTTVAVADAIKPDWTTDILTTTVTIANVVTTNSTITSESSTVSDVDFSCTYEGLYKAQDCSRFHVCYKIIWFMRHYLARCSEGLYWSSSEKRCVLQSLGDCP